MIIRKATARDAECIAHYMLLAMEEIVYGFLNRQDTETAKEFLGYFAQRENNQYSYQNCWVAEAQNEVVAAVNVYDGARLGTLRQPVVQYIQDRHNKAFLPEEETGPGEYYIDSLGVSPRHQGKGIGSKILQFLIDEYVIRQKQILGLLVDEENPDAKRLYERLGFKTAGKKLLFGKVMEHLQFKG